MTRSVFEFFPARIGTECGFPTSWPLGWCNTEMVVVAFRKVFQKKVKPSESLTRNLVKPGYARHALRASPEPVEWLPHPTVSSLLQRKELGRRSVFTPWSVDGMVVRQYVSIILEGEFTVFRTTESTFGCQVKGQSQLCHHILQWLR